MSLLRLVGPYGLNGPDIREDNRRERLEAHYADLTRNGNHLLRLSRQCSETANELFDQAQNVDQQLKEMP